MQRNETIVLRTESIYKPLPTRSWGRNVTRSGKRSTATSPRLLPSLAIAVVLICDCARPELREEPVIDGSVSRSSVDQDGSPHAVELSHGASAPETTVASRNVMGEGIGRSPALGDLCVAICERSRKLRCGSAAECERNCQAMGLVAGCNGQISAFYRCLAGQPLDRWECAEDGVAAIRDGFCEVEQERAVACVEMKTK